MSYQTDSEIVIVAKIARWLKEKYTSGSRDSFTLDDILVGTGQTFMSPKLRTWLANEVLEQNSRIRVVKPVDGQGMVRYLYKPTIDFADSNKSKNLQHKIESVKETNVTDDSEDSLFNLYYRPTRKLLTLSLTTDSLPDSISYNDDKIVIKKDDKILLDVYLPFYIDLNEPIKYKFSDQSSLFRSVFKILENPAT